MDWTAVIETHRTALARIVAMLVAMAGLGCGGQFTFFPQEGALPQGSAPAEKSKLSPAPTLPRHLYRAVLRLLRPAESAARRLAIVVARRLPMPKLAPFRLRKPALLRKTAGRLVSRGAAPSPAEAARACARRLPIVDPLRRFVLHRRPARNSVPRICVPGVTVPFPVAIRRPPAPDDPVDATCLGRRLSALAAALDDLPAQAKRFIRWEARNRRARDRGKISRLVPLRGGPPPGHRPAGRRAHEVHEVLDRVHELAFFALEQPDTS